MRSTGYIVDGIYHSGVQPATVPIESDSITYKAYDHDRQRENYRRDMIQPYVAGKPNPEFIQQFPEEAKEYYGSKE